MIKIKQAVIVEGKYDKIKLSTVLDTVIIQTDGFGIFKDKEKQKLIKRLAQTRGIVILTDSDSAGLQKSVRLSAEAFRKTASFTPIFPMCSQRAQKGRAV